MLLHRKSEATKAVKSWTVRYPPMAARYSDRRTLCVLHFKTILVPVLHGDLPTTRLCFSYYV
jgi:hypothetical protein